MDIEGRVEIMMLLAVMFKTKVSVTAVFWDVADIPDLLLVIIIVVIHDNVLDLMQDVKLFSPN